VAGGETMSPMSFSALYRRAMRRLPAVLFCMTVLAALALLGLLGIAPCLGEGSPRWLSLFGHDLLLRRTSLVSAAGLVVTAFVFFRPPHVLRPAWRPPRRRPRQPPQHMAGA
jgi:hypothetical protein